ncbi:MAG: hypothetical protein R3F05_10190 [Planctomycetota bacterium]|nr:hypothetical protein [Planctomycetota bacterium]MCB9825895.1 hypothetical protein [Planctomycetota bacterium]MCB9901294.1 hypothetical protein [Planctomycetota bacterium]
MRAPLTLLTACALVLVACGSQERGTDAEESRREEMLAQTMSANRLYAEAAKGFARSFALSDPLEAPASHRSRLAFRTGRALAAEALARQADPERPWLAERYAWASLVWLDEAEALDASLLAAIEPRAQLIESGLFGDANAERAAHLRQRFVEGVEARGGPEAALPTPAEREAYAETKSRIR